jgi:hypothetical protein
MVNTPLNEDQYQLLCEQCDLVLLASESTMETITIPWLHVIREHPVFLANYADLFEPVKSGKAIVRKWRRVLRSKAVWFRQLFRSLRADGKPWHGREELPRGIDVLFISHLLNPSHAGQEDDFYFGGLPKELAARGHSVVIALINHSGQPALYLADRWKESSVPRIILSGSLRIFEEAALRQRLKKESLRLKKLAKKEAPGLFQRVLFRASEEALSGESLAILRMGSQIGTLAEKLRPKTIVVTHEGYAWERMAFAAARRVRPNMRCIGYQHAALFRLQHAIRRNLAPEYNPDLILTAGTVGKELLERAPGLNGIPISVLGSNRIFDDDASGKRAMRSGQAAKSDGSACLVLPEGTASECHLLFEFSLACARMSPHIDFVWRLHPIMTYDSLAAQNPHLRNLPPNIVLSQKTLEEDIARCRWVLYRGTTAIIQAVLAGLKPVYLKLKDELSIDPIHELNTYRITVEATGDFLRVITDDFGVDKIYPWPGFEEAYNYCRRYFLPWDVTTLENEILKLEA